MKLLWHGDWIETPGYEVPDNGVLIEVSAAVTARYAEKRVGTPATAPRPEGRGLPDH